MSPFSFMISQTSLDPNIRRPSVLARPEGNPDCLVHFNRRIVFIAMDTEGIHGEWEPVTPRYSSYGFSVLDRSEVSCIAPGTGGRNWHKFLHLMPEYKTVVLSRMVNAAFHSSTLHHQGLPYRVSHYAEDIYTRNSHSPCYQYLA